MATIDEFKSQLIAGGVRSNTFKVFIPQMGENIEFMCKTAAIPGSTLPVVEVPFRGHKLKIAGDRTFEPWSITVMNDTDFKLYRGFERWMNGINNMTDNEGIANPADYQVDGFIDDRDIRRYLIILFKCRSVLRIVFAGIPVNES